MDQNEEKIAQQILTLAYKAPSKKEFNEGWEAVAPGVPKNKVPILLRDYLKAGKGLPQNSTQALRFLTYLPLPVFRQSPVFEKFLSVLSPEDKKKIPNQTGIWGDQPLLHARYQTLARILNRQ